MQGLGAVALALLLALTGCAARAAPSAGSPAHGCTLEDEADWYAALGQADAEILSRARLLTDDPQTEYNLAAALWDAGYDAEPWFRHALSRMHPADGSVPYAIDMIAEAVEERGDTEQAAALRAHAEYLEDRRDTWHCNARKLLASVDVVLRCRSR